MSKKQSSRQPPTHKSAPQVSRSETSPPPLRQDNEELFIEAICEEREGGFGFVPLIGAGLSAPSGVPIIVELRDYLRRCIAMALGLDTDDAWPNLRFHHFRRWIPGQDDWPLFGDPRSFELDATDWDHKLGEALQRMKQLARANQSCHPEEYIFQEAYGAMADWRTALLFLARLEKQVAPAAIGDDSSHLRLGAPNLDIIDTFFLSIVLKKKPTLGHRTLCRLADPLRIDTLLTTNFDDLTEQAFSEISRELTVFDVHVESGFPPFRDLQHKNSLIKIHGGRYGLRADYSLDAIPADRDQREFAAYLTKSPISPSAWKDECDFASKRHLLVVGVAADDARVITLIEAATKRLDEKFKIFWLGYSETDEKKARQLQSRLFPGDDKSPPSTRRFQFLRHESVGLFFLQLYQHITMSLPPTGAVFPSAARLPFPPQPLKLGSASAEERCNALVKDAEVLIQQCCESETPPPKRMILLESPVKVEDQPVVGLTTAAARLFFNYVCRTKYQCVWIDLDEIANADDLFEHLLHTIARKAGVVDWMPVLLQEHTTSLGVVERARIHEVRRLTNSPNRKWILFLNARDRAGANRRTSDVTTELNGWLDRSGDALAERACADAAIELLQPICGPACPNVTIVLSCFEGKFVKTLMEPHRESQPLRVHWTQTFSPLNTKESVTNALRWVKDRDPDDPATTKRDRARFLYAISLASRTRYPALMWAWACHGQSTHAHSESKQRRLRTQKWLRQLEDHRVIRRKNGGFVWMHCEIRNELREKLSTLRSYHVKDETPRDPQWVSRMVSQAVSCFR